MKSPLFTREFASRFKQTYCYSMGGTQTIIFYTGQSFTFNDKEYYSGRGSKYNSSIRHDNKGDILIAKKMVSEALKIDRENKKRDKEWEKKQRIKAKRIKEAKERGVYDIIPHPSMGSYIELSDDEANNVFYDAYRLANTLKISIEDAKLLRSRGKTYVFAKSEDGNIYELYHSNTDLNGLSIWVMVATPEKIAKFSTEAHKEWASAPFYDMVGGTDNPNHFVC